MLDYFQVEGLLNEEEKRFRDKVRKFVDEECMPLIATHFDRGTFPMELVRRMAEMGLFGLHVDGYHQVNPYDLWFDLSGVGPL